MRLLKSKRGLIFLVAILAMALIPAIKVMAGYSPADRPTFTWKKPAKYVVFDSITNNPKVGDERPFLSGHDVNSATNLDNISVHDGETVQLQIYYHNNASSNLHLVSKNTRVVILLPHAPATANYATGYITSDNASPRVIADTVDFTGASPYTMDYVPGSAQLWNNVFRGAQLSDSIVTQSGAQIGFDKIDGNIPGCENFSGFVTIKVKVHMPSTHVPAPTCNLLTVTPGDNRTVKAHVDYTLDGATLKNIDYSWGDGNHTTNTVSANASHQYNADGTYNINSTLTFDVNGVDQSAACSSSVTFKGKTHKVTKVVKETTVLPNTGSGPAIGIFAGASLLAGLGHYVVSRRRA